MDSELTLTDEMASPETPRKADIFGVICSVGCAIHCAATPILLSALPSVSSLQWLSHPLFHQVVAVVCMILVFRAIVPGWRHHRSRMVAGFASAGISLLMIAAFVLPDKCCDHHPVAGSEVGSEVAESFANSDEVQQPHNLVRFVSTREPLDSEANSNQVEPQTSHHACEHCIHGKTSGSTSSNLSNSPTTHKKWGAVLLPEATLVSVAGPRAAGLILGSQPYLTPLGGFFLIIAHLLNIRFSCCHAGKCGSSLPPRENNS